MHSPQSKPRERCIRERCPAGWKPGGRLVVYPTCHRSSGLGYATVLVHTLQKLFTLAACGKNRCVTGRGSAGSATHWDSCHRRCLSRAGSCRNAEFCRAMPRGPRSNPLRRTGGGIGSGHGSGSPWNTPLVELVQERLIANVQVACGKFSIPLGLFQCAQDHFLLGLFRSHG